MYTDLNDFLAGLAPSSPVPREVVDFPSMTTTGEKELLYKLARHHYRGTGSIIDAGLFLGASTNAFGWGIRHGPAYGHLKVERPIKAYEIAIWHSAGFDKYLANPIAQEALGAIRYKDGDDYFPTLRRLLAEHDELIEYNIGDIVKLAHSEGEIEIAFYDCLKNYERDWAAFKAFAPNFVPGRTIVVQQDYFYEDALDNKIRQEFLSDYFEYLGAVATSAVFMLKAEIPREFFVADPLPTLTAERTVELLENAAARIPVSAFRIYTELGVVRYMIGKKLLDAARARLDEIDKTIASVSLPPRPALIAGEVRAWLERVG